MHRRASETVRRSGHKSTVTVSSQGRILNDRCVCLCLLVRACVSVVCEFLGVMCQAS